MKVAFTLRSRNVKTGPIPVSTTEAASCPDACPLKSSGACYAKHGPLGMYWAKVNEGRAKAYQWADFTAMVAALPEGTLWRHNQAGDLPGEGDEIDAKALLQLVEANKGRKGFTYTHKPMSNPDNRYAIRTALRLGFTINLSADGLAEADQLADLGIAPVVTVVARDADNCQTPAGRKVVICPAQTHDAERAGKPAVSCKTCGLCQKADRQVIIGFRAHGVSAKKAEKIAQLNTARF
jgi:hypothetical protein